MLAALLIGTAQSAPVSASSWRDEPIRPIVASSALDASRVALGERLFHDPRLSSDDTISCASCHWLPEGGSDRRPSSIGIKGAVGNINSPTVFNSSLSVAQFWDGRARTLESQVSEPLHNPIEMGATWDQVLEKLRADAALVEQFQRAYPEGMTASTIADAIATFERSLTTPDSPFDRWLAGDDDALTPEAKEGYRLFKAYGCAACHQGANVGGNMFEKLGTMGDYFADRGGVTKMDYGRYNVTGDEADRFVFKVPSLRLVTLTPPYFHDASQEDLGEAITTMARYQLGRTIDDAEVELIIRFLESLVGRHEMLAR